MESCERWDRGAGSGAAGSTWIEKHVIYAGLNVMGYSVITWLPGRGVDCRAGWSITMPA